MKNSRVLKIILMALIMIIICTLSAKVKAYEVTYSGVVNSIYYFCRNKDVTLSRTGIINYVDDGNVYMIRYDNDSDINPNSNRIAWAYLFGKYQATYGASTLNDHKDIADSVLQKAFWTAINNDEFSNDTQIQAAFNNASEWGNLPDDSLSNALLRESYAYSTKAKEIANNEKATINSENARLVADGIIGPYSIDGCTYVDFKSQYGNHLIGGVSQLYVYYKDNTTSIHPEYKLVYKDDAGKFQDISTKTFGGESGLLTLENDFDTIVEFNKHISKPKPIGEFYIKLVDNSDDISKMDIKIKAVCRSLKPTFAIQPLKASNGGEQPLVYVTAALNNEPTIITTDANLTQELSFSLKKLNYNDVSLEGAEFKVTAEQMYSKAGSAIRNSLETGVSYNDETKTYTVKIPIIPNTANDKIYVLLEETKAPNGYSVITKPINMIWIYNASEGYFSPTLRPSSEDWLPFDLGEKTSTYGGWKYVNDGDSDVPNTYVTLKEGIETEKETEIPSPVDYKQVENKIELASYENKTYTINIYDERVIKEINLSKVDESGNRLTGAEFFGSISNIKSFEDQLGNIYFPTEGTTYTIEEEKPISIGSLKICNVVLADPDNDIEISLLEKTSPGEKYKKIEGEIKITISCNSKKATVTYEKQTANVKAEVKTDENGVLSVTIKVPNKKLVDISGYVWLDDQLGIKPAKACNGLMEDSEDKVPNITVRLYHENGGEPIAITTTGEDGSYKFTGQETGNYRVEFEYDGINYEDTYTEIELAEMLRGGQVTIPGVTAKTFNNAIENGTIITSKVTEEKDRDTFNNKFKTIINGKATSEGLNISLEYEYKDEKSVLKTTQLDNDEKIKVKADFLMTAETDVLNISEDTTNINLGLRKRGVDLALSTNFESATQNEENLDYNLTDGTITAVDNSDIYVKYKIELKNQSIKTAYVNSIEYDFDNNYLSFDSVKTGSANNSGKTNNYSMVNTQNGMSINLNKEQLNAGETQEIYLVFKVKTNGEFTTKAEITSYSTDEGLIDVDSQPGNYLKNNTQIEDDNDKVTLKIVSAK